MVVLCENRECGAVLRVADTYSPTQTVVRRDGDQHFFDCPRCGKRTTVAAQAASGAASPVARQPTR